MIESTAAASDPAQKGLEDGNFLDPFLMFLAFLVFFTRA
jgi:hypothetical protein